MDKHGQRPTNMLSILVSLRHISIALVTEHKILHVCILLYVQLLGTPRLASSAIIKGQPLDTYLSIEREIMSLQLT